MQRIAHQERPQVGAADADVHHMLEFLAGDPALLPAAHRGHVRLELLARLAHLGLDVGAAGEA